MIHRFVSLVSLFILLSCGGSSSENSPSTVKAEDVFQQPQIIGKEIKISTLASVPVGDEAVWYLQLVHQGRKLGECKIEVIDNSSNENIIGFSDESNPDCDGIVIDPSSTSANLKLEVEDQGLEYCILIGGQKTCQEVSI